MIGSSAPAAGTQLAANYFEAVARGQHVHGREFDYIAATPWSRTVFLGAAYDVLQPIARWDPNKQGYDIASSASASVPALLIGLALRRMQTHLYVTCCNMPVLATGMLKVSLFRTCIA